MTIQKPDFNQIFASQAPDVDKPPVFNNYNGGMGDEYRPNNGKPTIKGFNYIQNLNDNKFLWMVQNGAFPYDSNTEYNVGIVTLKDGRFKQWDGTNWINFGQDDGALKSANNLSDLPNKTTARNNLDVYSKSETDAKLAPTPDATETVVGKAKIATTEIAQAGVNDTDFLTAKKLRDALNVGGRIHATLYARSIGGVTTVLKSKNILSVVRTAAGAYTVTTITNMDDVNYTLLGLSGLQNGQVDVQGYVMAENFGVGSTPDRTINSFKLNFASRGTYADSYAWGVSVVC